MNPAYNSSRTPRWLYILVAVMAVFVLARIGFAIYERMSTGTLQVTTSEPNAIISVSQADKQAAFIGKGNVSTRLKPGDYLVSATLSGDRTLETVHIAAGRTVSKKMNPAHVAPPLSSTAATGFINFDSLINLGMTTDQVLDVQKLISQFSPKAQIVSIDASTTTPLPQDPTTVFLKATFDFTIDKVPYHALITYVGFGGVSISITDATGTQVFSSAADSAEG